MSYCQGCLDQWKSDMDANNSMIRYWKIRYEDSNARLEKAVGALRAIYNFQHQLSAAFHGDNESEALKRGYDSGIHILVMETLKSLEPKEEA